MSKFDRDAERQEDREQRRESVEIIVQELKALNRSICCIFLNETEEILHGRLEGMLAELDAVVLRDLTPGRQALQCKTLVPYDSMKHMCLSPSDSNCRQCEHWQEVWQAHVQGKKD